MKKMNISMGFLKPVQNFFKKYTALLPSIGIVIVALLLFFPTLMVGKGVKKKMEASGRDASTVRSLSSNIPSKDDPEQIKRNMDQLDEVAAQIEAFVTQSSQRELVSYDVFPPKSTSPQLYMGFGNQYRRAIELMVENMNAKDAPSSEEIATQTGGTVQRAGVTRSTRRKDTTNPMVDALCLKRSQEISVYANPSLFSWYEFWEDYEFQGEDPGQIDCWDAQIAYWIYEDIAATINTMNSGSGKVSSSPVKRLMGFSFTNPVFGSSTGSRAALRSEFGRPGRSLRGGGAADRDKPNYVQGESSSGATTSRTSRMSSASTTGLSSNFLPATLTDRKGDEDVDVIHFAFSVLVDNRMVMAFMQELCSEKSHTFRVDFKADGEEVQARRNQISILQSNLSVVDKQADEHKYYRYGKGAVMQLDLICEYQFVRKGYDSIKPDQVKAELGQSEAAEASNTNTRTSTPARPPMRPGRPPIL